MYINDASHEREITNITTTIINCCTVLDDNIVIKAIPNTTDPLLTTRPVPES